MNNPLITFDPCGMEVSFRTLLVALRRRDRGEPLREFPNTPEGHQAVLRFLARSGRAVRVCLESTGLYGLDLARTLHQAGLELMVANPGAVRHFTTALMQRSKNDHLDAQVLCEFAARMPFQPWRPPSPPALKLVAVAWRLIKGDELKGLGKLAAFLRILNFGVPLWLFIIVLVAAILGAIQWVRQPRTTKSLYVLWDAVQCLWGTGAIGNTPAMRLIMKGFFTNSDVEKALLITQVYLEGTRAAMGLLEPLQIPAQHSVEETLHAFVQPVVGQKGHPYKGNLILVDQFDRKHKLSIQLRGIDPIAT